MTSRDEPFKECFCGATFTVGEWRQLPCIGIQDLRSVHADERPYELRTCSRCGSSIAMHVPYVGGTDYPHPSAALDEYAWGILVAYVELRRESEMLPTRAERELDALDKFVLIEESSVTTPHLPPGMSTAGVRAQVRSLAARRYGAEFTRWLDSMMARLSARGREGETSAL